ncbi:MAG: DUF3810 domain-containing protein [Polaribacter sp.]|nr:DUF3810 domain-containing protein [Polaribacter sp.]
MKHKKTTIYLSIFLGIQIIFVQFISNYPSFIERYYSNGIYLYISAFLRIIFGWIPFSIGDLFLAVLGFLLLRFIFRLIKNRFKNLIPKLLQLTAFTSILYCCFYLFWGFNYFREPLAKNLKLEQANYTTEQLTTVAEKIILSFNTVHLQLAKNDSLKIINPYTQKEMHTKALDGYSNISKTYPQLTYTHPSVKSSLMSLLQSYIGTAGYLNPLTGEAHINDRIPKTATPTTTCHEMAHQLGFAAENEANFVGFLAAVSNEDVYFQYSGYRMAFGYVISEIRKRNPALAKALWKTINKGIVKDFQASTNFWRQYQNPIEPFVKKGYNSYLKANKQSKGTQSYNYVVNLLIAYFQKNDK